MYEGTQLDTGPDRLGMTAQIVTAYVTRNPIAATELPKLIRIVHDALRQPSSAGTSHNHTSHNHMSHYGTRHFDENDDNASAGTAPDSQTAQHLRATPEIIRQSIGDDYLICLEDGVKMTMLKRYIAGRFGLTPEQYRLKWGLPSDYPMVAPAYAKHRSHLAKQAGLGYTRGMKAHHEPLQTKSQGRAGTQRARYAR